MRAIRMRCMLVFVAMITMFPAGSGAQNEEIAFRATLRTGTCAERGDRIARLETPTAPSGEAAGARTGETALISETVVDVPFADLLGTDSALVITRNGDPGVVACGAVGGPLTTDGGVVIHVAAVEDTEVWGIAVVAPNGEEAARTDVTLYLAGEGVSDASVDQSLTERDKPVAGDAPSDDDLAATETYVSPTYGYSLTYDPALWRVVDGPSSDGGVDVIGLETTGSSVYLTGMLSDLDAPTCVEAMVASFGESPGVTGSAPLEDDGSAISGGTATDAEGAYVLSLSNDDGSVDEQNVYLRCIVVAPGQMLIIDHFWRILDYEAAAERLAALVAGLDLP